MWVKVLFILIGQNVLLNWDSSLCSDLHSKNLARIYFINSSISAHVRGLQAIIRDWRFQQTSTLYILFFTNLTYSIINNKDFIFSESQRIALSEFMNAEGTNRTRASMQWYNMFINTTNHLSYARLKRKLAIYSTESGVGVSPHVTKKTKPIGPRDDCIITSGCSENFCITCFQGIQHDVTAVRGGYFYVYFWPQHQTADNIT